MCHEAGRKGLGCSMKKDFDYLLRNTFFLAWEKQQHTFDQDAVVAFCRENNFGHLMLDETKWCRSAGWYESVMSGGHSELKLLARKLHEHDILLTLHGEVTRIHRADPLFIKPRQPGLMQRAGDPYGYVDPRGELQRQISARFVAIADLVDADGIYLDWVAAGYAATLKSESAEKQAAIVAAQRSLTDQLTRSILLQTAVTTDELKEYWCFSGQRDNHPNVQRLGGYNYTRDSWNDEQIRRAEEAISQGYPPQLGWIDFEHGVVIDGKKIEDQNPASMAKMCTYAKEHNMPIVLQGTLRKIKSHPQKDEILSVIRDK